MAVLRPCGYAAEGSAHRREALDRLRCTERLPCVILLDCTMRIMTGDEFCAEVVRDDRLARIPVVSISANRESLGNIERIPKPFAIKDVLAVVERYRH